MKTIQEELARARDIDTANPPPLSTSEVALFARRLAHMTTSDADFALIGAEDILSEDGMRKASMIADGMRAGIDQARRADAGDHVVAIWFDDNSARLTLSWPGDDGPGGDMAKTIIQAVTSAMTPNGEMGNTP